jgi:hypothetical protein
MYVYCPSLSDYNLVFDQIHARLIDNVAGYGAQTTSWSRVPPRWSDGGTGYYGELPRDSRNLGFDDIIGERPTYELLPTIVVAGSYTPLTVIVNEIYEEADLTNIGAFSNGTVLSEIYFLRKPASGGDLIITIFRNTGEMAIVDLSDNTYKYVNTGIYKPWKPIYHEATDSITVFAGGGSEVKVFTYYLGDDTTFESAVLETGEGVQSRKIGTDGVIYFGAQRSTKVFSYDPDTQDIEEYGAMMVGLGSTYIYDIAGDAGFVYSILRGPDTTLQYWIAIYNKTTTEVTYRGYGNGFTQQGAPIQLYKDESTNDLFWVLYLQSSPSLPNQIFKYKDGVEVSLDTDTNLSLSADGYLPLDYNSVNLYPDTFGYEVDIKELTVTGKIKYKTLAASDFTELVLTDVELAPLGSSFIKLSDGDLLRAVGAYSQFTRIDPFDDSVIENKDMPDASIYDALKVGTKVYFCGYANITCVWDTEEDWNLGEYELTDPLSNPRQLPFNILGGFYHLDLIDKDDYMYVGVQKERTTTGIAIGWFNKSTFAVDSTDANALLKEELRVYAYCKLLRVSDKLILVGRNAVPNAKGRIWIWDISGGHDLNLITPTVIDISSELFRPSNAFVVDENTLILIQYRNICKVNIAGTPTFDYKSVPDTINMTDSDRYVYDTANGLLYFLASVSSSHYLYSVRVSDWVFTRLSSALPTTLLGPRIMSLVNDTLYMIGTLSYTDFGIEERNGAWIEKLEL